MVVADTSVWIEYFSGGEESVRAALRALIRSGQAVVVGVVLAELLQGCRTKKDSAMILSTLTGLRFLETNFSTWQRTGELGSSLQQRGITLPISDLVIASAAIEHDCPVFTLDAHFRQIPGVRLHRPARVTKRSRK